MTDQVEDLKVTDGAKIILDYVENETSSTNILVRASNGSVKQKPFSSFSSSSNRNIDGGSATARYTAAPINGGGA